MGLRRVEKQSAALVLLLATSGCLADQDPASYLTGLRILTIKAEPPEVAPGASANLTALVLDTQGRMIDIAWAECLRPPLQGQVVHPDCITNATAEYLVPIGNGPMVTAVMPMYDPASRSFGRPDATGGVYLPIRSQAVAGTEAVTAVYRLRVLTMPPANQNPVLSEIYQITPAVEGGPGEMQTPLNAMSPLVVHAGEELTLRAAFNTGSAETYAIYDGPPDTTPPRGVTERLSVSFFATAGSLSAGTSGTERADTILKLDKHLPAAGTPIELYIVGRDERGGIDYQRRTLRFE